MRQTSCQEQRANRFSRGFTRMNTDFIRVFICVNPRTHVLSEILLLRIHPKCRSSNQQTSAFLPATSASRFVFAPRHGKVCRAASGVRVGPEAGNGPRSIYQS